jgi:uncharacterized protein YbbC (DUF1343 family)
MKTRLFSILIFVFVFVFAHSAVQAGIKTGAEQTEKYLPMLKGKRVAIVANQTSVIGKTSVVDSLKSLGVNLRNSQCRCGCS